MVDAVVPNKYIGFILAIISILLSEVFISFPKGIVTVAVPLNTPFALHVIVFPSVAFSSSSIASASGFLFDSELTLVMSNGTSVPSKFSIYSVLLPLFAIS